MNSNDEQRQSPHILYSLILFFSGALGLAAVCYMGISNSAWLSSGLSKKSVFWMLGFTFLSVLCLITAVTSWRKKALIPIFLFNHPAHVNMALWFSLGFLLISVVSAFVCFSPDWVPVALSYVRKSFPFWVWLSLVSAMLSMWLIYNTNDRLRIVYSLFFSSAFLILVVFQVQKFLFPAENYWLPVAAVFFLFAILEAGMSCVLKRQNFFLALDENKVSFLDFCFVAGMPLLLAVFLWILIPGNLFYDLTVILFGCMLQSFAASRIYKMTKFLNHEEIHFDKKSMVWVLSIAGVLLMYFLAIKPLKVYESENPIMAQQDPVIHGVWYVMPAQRSSLYPFGYGRFEDSVYDDLGHPLFAAWGQTLGFVKRCNTEFPYMANAQKLCGNPQDFIQPRFAYAWGTLCPEWAETLPSFYWSLGLMSLLLLSVFAGIFILKDPIDFFLIALLLLGVWKTWPVSAKSGQVEALVLGLAMVVFLPWVIKKSSSSGIIFYSLCCGFVSGVSEFIRQPMGLALTVASVILIVSFSLIHKKNVFFTAAFLIVFFAGLQIKSGVFNGLQYYRDMRLQITAPRVSALKHGAGMNLLGGIGGFTFDYNEIIPNSLDMAFWDAVMWMNVYNENPLADSYLNYWTLMFDNSGLKLFVRYIEKYPWEFARITFSKAKSTLQYMITGQSNWPIMLMIFMVMSGIWLCFDRYLFRLSENAEKKNMVDEYEFLWLLLGCVIITIISSLPAISTDPFYGQNYFPAAFMLCLTAFLALYFVFFRILYPKR